MTASAPPRQKIAIIGTGITGLVAAYLLRPHHDVMVFEREGRLGGHANTVTLPDGVDVDSGFIVYNKWTYPNLIRLFDHLDVPTQKSDMGFSVCTAGGKLQYAGQGLGTLFAQRKNIVNPRFLGLVLDLVRFYWSGKRFLKKYPASDMNLGQYLQRGHYGRAFIDDHLLPMAAAIWSMPDREILEFPVVTFLRFCNNHGLLNLVNRPVWRTVTGGSKHYIARLTRNMGDVFKVGEGVTHVVRGADGVTIKTKNSIYFVDQVVVATHADEALSMLEDARDDEKSILGAFRFTENDAYVHGDDTLMPPLRRVWSAWNYIRADKAAGARVFVTYWMNALQTFLPKNRDVFVSLNPPHRPAPDKTYHHIVYTHPAFDGTTLMAQKNLWRIQGKNRTWFCGAWTGYGFHEDGAASGIAVAEKLGASLPWKPVPHEASTARRHTIGPDT